MPFMGILKFYRECLARAFTGKLFLIEKWSGGLGLLAVVATRFAPIPESWDGMIMDDLPLYFFLLIFLSTVFVGFVIAPYSIYKEEREKAFLLQKSRDPKLKVFIKDTVGTTEVSGNTNQTMGGMRLATHLHAKTRSAVSLVVTNIGETRVANCTACLIWIERLDGEEVGEVELFEPILLPWDFSDTEESLSCSIEPGMSKRVWIADVNYSGWLWVMRETEQLPADCIIYLVVQAAIGQLSKSAMARHCQCKLKSRLLALKMRGSTPMLGGVASISMLEQASPSLSPPSTQA